MAAHRARREPIEPELPPLPGLETALARATDETRLVARIAQHAHAGEPTSWRAAAWLLEHEHPSRWGADRQRARDATVDVSLDDPFTEVDELAAKRRRKRSR